MATATDDLGVFLSKFSVGEGHSNYNTPHGILAGALANIVAERQKQDAKWGQQDHHPVYWTGILAEELGEVAKGSIELDGKSAGGDSEQFHAIMELREEVVQIAAVAVAMIECIDRGELDKWYGRE